MATRNRQIDAGAEYLGPGDTRTLGEISGHGGIDVVDKPLPKDALEMEAFMNEMVNVDDMDSAMPGWQFQQRQDRPQRLVAGMTTGKLHLWPVPAQAGAIRLTVQRLPLKPLRDAMDKPEIRPELHRSLVHWMLYKAYGREDTDLHNDAKAAVALAKFEAEFGRKASGRNEEWVRSGEVGVPGALA